MDVARFLRLNLNIMTIEFHLSNSIPDSSEGGYTRSDMQESEDSSLDTNYTVISMKYKFLCTTLGKSREKGRELHECREKEGVGDGFRIVLGSRSKNSIKKNKPRF